MEKPIIEKFAIAVEEKGKSLNLFHLHGLDPATEKSPCVRNVATEQNFQKNKCQYIMLMVI